MKVTRRKDDMVVATHCMVTEKFMERFFGLMGQDRLEEGSALWITPCNSIHTFFMRFPIDVLYIDANEQVLKIKRSMNPWRMDFPVFGAKSVLELPGGGAKDLREGDQLCLS